MGVVELILLAVGLAMDAFAVSVAAGVTIHRLHLGHALRVGFFFGAFQAGMPLVGWLAGSWARELIAAWDHWAVFGLLVAIGIKMIIEGSQDPEEAVRRDPTHLAVLFLLALATSIDALAAGVGLAVVAVDILLAVAVIGAVTFALSFGGVLIGDRFGHLSERRLEVAGGLILIGIGTRVLLEHLLIGF